MAQTKCGTTSINLKYSPVNQAWIVWREDSGHQAMVQVFNDQEEAREEYNKRVSFFMRLVRV